MKKSTGTAVISVLIFTVIAAVTAACGAGAAKTASSAQSYPMTSAASYDAANSFSYYSSDMAVAETAAETMAAAAAYDYDYDYELADITGGMWEEGGYDSGLGMPAAPEPAEEAGAAGGDSSAGGGTDSTQPARKLIRTVNLNAETTEFDTLITSISQFVEASGGYIEQSDISGNSISSAGGRRYAHVTARIPADSLDSFLSRMNEQSNVTYRSESVQDITLTYTDIESRKKSLTIEQERLWELLEKADSLESVIALEERLSEIRYELEKYGSQLRTYDNQVDYSTVYINIDEVAVFTPTEPDSVMTRIQKGFSRSLHGVGNTFVDLFVWLVSSLPVLFIWAVLIAVIVLIIKMLIRRLRKKAAARPYIAAAAPAAAAAATMAPTAPSAPGAAASTMAPSAPAAPGTAASTMASATDVTAVWNTPQTVSDFSAMAPTAPVAPTAPSSAMTTTMAPVAPITPTAAGSVPSADPGAVYTAAASETAPEKETDTSIPAASDNPNNL